jgi:hypothetical protein
MKTEGLIETLSHDVAPAPPLAGPWTRSAVWLLGTLVYFSVLLLMMTSVPKVAANGRDWLFVFQQFAAVSTAAAAAGAAFALTVPGYPTWSLRLATVAAFAWVASVILGTVQEWTRNDVNLAVPGEWACVVFILLGGLLPAVTIVCLLRRGAPLAPGLTTALAVLASTALASVTACLSHPHPSDAVTFVWHGTTVLLLVAMAASTGRLVLKWKTMTPH